LSSLPLDAWRSLLSLAGPIQLPGFTSSLGPANNDQSLATWGRCLHLLTDLEEATSESLTHVLVFILTVIVTDPRTSSVDYLLIILLLVQGSVARPQSTCYRSC